MEVEDGAEQELEEEDCLTSVSVTESTITIDVVLHTCGNERWTRSTATKASDDASASEDADAVSSNGADDCGDGVYLEDAASLYDKHTTITPPIAKVQLSVTTAMATTIVNLTRRRSEGLLDHTLLRSRPPESGNGLPRSWRQMVSSTRVHASSVR